MNIEKIPYVDITASITKDEYGKIIIEDVSCDNAEILNIVDNKHNTNTLHNLNFNSSKWTPQVKDKIYFMKGCTVPRVKLKDLSVKYKIRTTTDLSAATVVVGSNRAGEKLFRSGWMHLIHPKVFLATVESLKEVSHDFDGYYSTQIDDLMKGFDLNELQYVGVDWHTANLCNPRNQSNGELPKKILEKLNLTQEQYKSSEYAARRNSNHVYTITDDNLKVYEEVQSKNIIEQNALLEVVNGDDAVLIDLDTYQNLRNMFKSSDSDNHVMAMEIMANANYLESLLFLEMLFFHHSSQIDCSRTKNHVNFKSLKNYLGRDAYTNGHIDSVIESLLSFRKLDQNALAFIMADQKEYFNNNGYSNYIQPTSYGINPEYQPQLDYQWVHKTEAFVDKTIVTAVEEKEVVEDSVDKVAISEAVEEFSAHVADPETEEVEVETEEEVTEEVLIAKKEEVKNEEEFDWF